MERMHELIVTWGDGFWTWLLLPLLVGVGLYFTIRSGVVQLVWIPEMLRTLVTPTPKTKDGKPQSVSSFQAFTISAASRVGVGNIAGVGTAIAIGGPGAVFWMWIMAFIGGASSFVESTLAQLFKRTAPEGFRGGPAYYIWKGLGQKWAANLFAVILIVTFPFAFSPLQANTIVATLTGSFDAELPWLPFVLAVGLSLLTGAVVFGGLRRIGKVTEALVPAMALLYLLLGLIIVAINIHRLPEVFLAIFTQAFGPNQVTGAAFGMVLLTGIRRGMFSNEAGLGSAPNAGAAAAVTHPVKQGLVQTLGVYFDTFLVCSITAFIILVSTPDLENAPRGITLTQNALVDGLGAWSNWLLVVIVFLLAFSSIIGNYYYGQANVEFLSSRPSILLAYRSVATIAIFVGSLLSADLIWDTADQIMGVMALINLIAILFLSKLAWKLMANYQEQKRRGLDPVFLAKDLPEVKGLEWWQSYEQVTGRVSPGEMLES